MHHGRVSLVTLSILGLAASAFPSAANAATEPAPFDETFTSAVPYQLSQTPDGTLTNLQINCVEGGGISTASFTFTGTATGAYPGTYTETATAKIDSARGASPAVDGNYGNNGYLVGYDATFTVTSGNTTITGEKHLNPSAPPVETACTSGGANNTNFSVTSGGIYALNFTTTITTSESSYQSTGSSRVEATLIDAVPRPNVPAGRDPYGYFNEYFQSNGAPTLLMPTDKDQCKKGGWQTYGVFRNQGDCVSYVATHGKNPPAAG